ncbi:energy transducer TonB [Neolewinella aurantiaca]|uniref:Energy transducer TonB n=2 Tax=Neolewinella aurantiaca TaxID=2602767 RepID=A0A5C7FL17_9BACT|nr:energy transducer TonB [Neolewinella aurantiaca]
MMDQGIRWTPGRQAGNPVRVQFNLPVRFKMADHEFPPPPPPPKADEVIRAEDLERIPLFPGCEDLGTYEEQKECADQKMVEFIYYNTHYPPLARENEVEGTAVISFVIEKDGRIGEIKIMENPGAGTGEEALRVFKLFNEKGLKFNPLGSSGRAVRVLVHFPVNFSLN